MPFYNVQFTERRPNGRSKPMKVQRVGPLDSPAQAWEWVSVLLKGSTPEVLARLVTVKVEPEAAVITPAMP